MLGSIEGGRDPHSQRFCTEHTAGHQVGRDPKAPFVTESAQTACTPARVVAANGLEHHSVVLHLCAQQVQGRGEHQVALKDRVCSLKDTGGLLRGKKP